MKIIKNYRRLKKDEIILPLDEVQDEDGSWVNTTRAGDKAPDPQYGSHRQYRRRVVDQESWMKDIDRFRDKINQMKLDWAEEREALIQDRESALDVTEETYVLIRKIIAEDFEDLTDLKMYIRKHFLIEKEYNNG